MSIKPTQAQRNFNQVLQLESQQAGPVDQIIDSVERAVLSKHPSTHVPMELAIRCKYDLRGKCDNGDACKYAHSDKTREVFSRYFNPLWKQRACINQDRCQFGAERCVFWHKGDRRDLLKEELRAQTPSENVREEVQEEIRTPSPALTELDQHLRPIRVPSPMEWELNEDVQTQPPSVKYTPASQPPLFLLTQPNTPATIHSMASDGLPHTPSRFLGSDLLEALGSPREPVFELPGPFSEIPDESRSLRQQPHQSAGPGPIFQILAEIPVSSSPAPFFNHVDQTHPLYGSLEDDSSNLVPFFSQIDERHPLYGALEGEPAPMPQAQKPEPMDARSRLALNQIATIDYPAGQSVLRRGARTLSLHDQIQEKQELPQSYQAQRDRVKRLFDQVKPGSIPHNFKAQFCNSLITRNCPCKTRCNFAHNLFVRDEAFLRAFGREAQNPAENELMARKKSLMEKHYSRQKWKPRGNISSKNG